MPQLRLIARMQLKDPPIDTNKHELFVRKYAEMDCTMKDTKDMMIF